MPENGVLKILYVLDILKKTDEYHPITAMQIIEELEKEGFHAERKTIGRYVNSLIDDMGYEIVLSKDRNGWYMIGQEFEDHELKMLVDAVAAAKFLTVHDSRTLIKKIRSLATKEGERIIKATMVMDDSLKLVDKKFALKFDIVMRAIADRRQIRFQYEELSAGNKKKLKKDGVYYQISPYYLGVWKHEYFVVANTRPYNNTTHYRVEMMKNVEILDEAIRPMSEIDELKKIGTNGRTFGNYIRESVNLWSGNVKQIKLTGKNVMRREVMKKFGNDLNFRDQEEEKFAVYIKAADSLGFYQWIAQFGDNIKIESPDECVENFMGFLRRTLQQYESL